MRRLALFISLLTGLPVAAAAEPPIATVGSETITRAELETYVKPSLIEVDNQRYEILRDGLDELIAEALLDQEAKARKMTREALEKSEIESKVSAPTEAEIGEVYEKYKEQLNNASLDEAKPRIVEFLKQQKGAERTHAYLDELKKKYKTVVSLEPPVVEVGTGDRPPRGSAEAKVTIVEFSDYECPFCKQAEAAVDKVVSTYGDKIRLYYRDFPLSFHAHARKAAEASRCANAQGKFWEYHDKLMASSDLEPAAMKKLAGNLGLEQAKFDKCLDDGTFKDAVEKDFLDGASVGINGTPAFFINGRMISGAQPFEKFKELIDEELARK